MKMKCRFYVLYFSKAIPNCAESMVKATKLCHYAYIGINPAISCKMVSRELLGIHFLRNFYIPRSPRFLTNDILLAAGTPNIPNMSNPTDKTLFTTCPFGLSIAAQISPKKDSAAYEIFNSFIDNNFKFKV